MRCWIWSALWKLPTSTSLEVTQFQNAPISVLSFSAKRPPASRISCAAAAFFFSLVHQMPPATTATVRTVPMTRRLRRCAAARSAIRRWYSSIPGGAAPRLIG